jgi:hypothetical protein
MKQVRSSDAKKKATQFPNLRTLLLMFGALIALGQMARAQGQVTLGGPTCIDGLQVSINGAASGNPSSIEWNWGDGTTNPGWFPQNHTYASAGMYTVQVTAYYSGGSSSPPASEMVTVGPGVSQGCGFTLSTTSLTFATQIVGTTSAPQSVTLTNISGGTLAISIAVSGNFNQTNTCGSSVPVGGTCTISATFTPLTTGNLSGAISVNTDASTLTISLGGGGVVVPTVFPSKLNFGSQQVAQTSLPESIKFTNWGGTELSISSIKISGPNKADFAETNTCGSSVAGGVSCEIYVTFTPATTGSRSATISITDNGGHSPQKVPLSGTGANLTPETLSVTIGGLPSGTNGNVTVTGPDGTYTLTQTTTLTNLTPGTYDVTGTIVPSTAPNTVYVPTVVGRSVVVGQSYGAAGSVSYSKLVANWKSIGPSAIKGFTYGLTAAGKLPAFAVSNANPLLMYAGGGNGPGNSGPYTEAGIYKTTNGGTTWTQQNKGLTDPTVGALWIDQSNTSIIAAGTNVAGIFRSTNAGATWTLVPTSPPGPVSAFLQVGTTLYAATSQGISASLDTGKSWTIVESTTVPVRALVEQGGVIYAGLDNGEIMIQSTPGGSWVPSTPASDTIWSIAINPGNPQDAFAVEWIGYAVPDLYLTQNEGASWMPITNMPADCVSKSQPVECAAQFAAFDPNTSVFYTGTDGRFYQSPDDGATWSPVSTGGWDIRLIVPSAAGIAGNLLVGSDQGLYSTQDGGTDWTSLNGNITSSILYGVGVSGKTILTAVQDFGPIQSFDGGTTWATGTGIGGEGGTVVFNPVNPAFVYTFTTAGFQYSTDGGETFTSVSALGGIGSEYDEYVGGQDTIAVDPNNASTLYVTALSGIYESMDWGVSWVLVSSWSQWFGPSASTPNIPQTIAVSPANSQTLFVGVCNSIEVEGTTTCNFTANTGSLLYTTNGGSSWQVSNLPSNCGWPVAIAINPGNPQMILVATNGSPILSCGILRSTDGGANFSASTGVSQILSSRQQGCNTSSIPSLQVDPSTSGAIAAATPAGVYLSTDFGLNWTSIRGNTVPLTVTEAIWSGGYLYESTCGEGVLRLLFAF